MKIKSVSNLKVKTNRANYTAYTCVTMDFQYYLIILNLLIE